MGDANRRVLVRQLIALRRRSCGRSPGEALLVRATELLVVSAQEHPDVIQRLIGADAASWQLEHAHAAEILADD